MSDLILPNPEDFVPVDARPACPICGKPMIHVEIRTPRLRNFHGWLCDCESQPPGVMLDIRVARESDEPGQAIVFDERGREASE